IYPNTKTNLLLPITEGKEISSLIRRLESFRFDGLDIPSSKLGSGRYNQWGGQNDCIVGNYVFSQR
ncbi:MAG: hypothetical protein WBY28_06705, partial [Nitrososphaeraceae archaeon]